MKPTYGTYEPGLTQFFAIEVRSRANWTFPYFRDWSGLDEWATLARNLSSKDFDKLQKAAHMGVGFPGAKRFSEIFKAKVRDRDRFGNPSDPWVYVSIIAPYLPKYEFRVVAVSICLAVDPIPAEQTIATPAQR